MSKFSKQELVEISQKLAGELLRVNEQITELTKQDPFSDTDRLNDNAAIDAEAQEETNHERVAALLEELKHKKSEIEAAIARISDGSYGQCLDCKKEIGRQRLQVMPTAQFCMDCQAKRHQ